MMEETNWRMERIEKLLHELRHEITRGMMEHEIPEEFGIRWYVPNSRHFPRGVVFCEFRARPMPEHALDPDALNPRLKVVK